MDVIQKGYGEITLVGEGEVVQGELTLYAEGWISAAPVPAEEGKPPRWFPNHSVAELVWRKSLATQRRE